jgi:hypothetical protein
LGQIRDSEMVCPAAGARALTCCNVSEALAGRSYSARRTDKFQPWAGQWRDSNAVPTASIPLGVAECKYLLGDGWVVRSPNADSALGSLVGL